jgi:hypothetical protein
MTKKIKSTFETFIESLSPEERKKYDEEYKELLLSELILATQAKDIKAIKTLTKMIEMTPSHEKKNI